MIKLARILKNILTHPLTKNNKLGAAFRFFKWQVVFRLTDDYFFIPWIKGTHLIAKKGMSGSTGNIYCGLYEFEEMAFLLHFLRKDDLFLDIGANVGIYSLLAAGCCHSRVIAFEPIGETYRELQRCISFNGILNLVDCKKLAVGEKAERIYMSSNNDTMNYVIDTKSYDCNKESVDCVPLDSIISEQLPIGIKIDTEGYELDVLLGAKKLLSSESLKVVIFEVNNCLNRYNRNEQELIKLLKDNGFFCVKYDPFSKKIYKSIQKTPHDNYIYVKDETFIQKRLDTAPKFKVLTTQL